MSRCKHCYVEGSSSEVRNPGPHHEILQGCFRRGFQAPHDGRMACPRAEGVVLKCGKGNCPMEAIVMWGFVYQMQPERMMRFAGRGASHSVQCRNSECHDYPCDEIFNGIRSVADVARQENSKARRLFQYMDRQIDELSKFFAMGAARLVELLPHIESDKVLHLGSPPLASAKAAPTLVAFDDPASHEDCEKAFREQRDRLDSAKAVVCKLVQKLHVVRCVRSQLVPQCMGGRRVCIDKVMSFLGRHVFLQISNSFFSFTWDELPPPPVVQDVDHDEAAASIDEQMASLNMEHKLADVVTRLNGSVPFPDASRSSSHEMEEIYLLEYNRHPESFRKALCEGAPLHACRSALEEANCKYILGSGAKVFVHPHQYVNALVAVTELGVDLRPFHVIVAESLQYNVEACLNDLSYRQGARIKRQSTILERTNPGDKAAEDNFETHTVETTSAASHGPVPGTSTGTGAEDACLQETQQLLSSLGLDVKRTLICEAPRHRNPESVTQSTTEVHSGGLNPRRVISASLSD